MKKIIEVNFMEEEESRQMTNNFEKKKWIGLEGKEIKLSEMRRSMKNRDDLENGLGQKGRRRMFDAQNLQQFCSDKTTCLIIYLCLIRSNYCDMFIYKSESMIPKLYEFNFQFFSKQKQ